MKRLLLRHLGLVPPYRFERTLLALLALLLLAGLALAALWMAGRHQLSAGTPRAHYLLYVAALLGAALVLVRVGWLSGTLLALAALELGFGVGSLALYKLRLIPAETLAPTNLDGLHIARSAWHPLLQGRMVPAAPSPGRPFAIDAEGNRGPHHAPDALRQRRLVALFGGSSTFDFNRDGASWGDRLQALLGDGYAVSNRGMIAYGTAEHVVQTAFYERTGGVTPACAVYYAGWNDMRNAHQRDLDPAYADYHLRNQVDSFRARRTDFFDSISPLATFIGRIAGALFDTPRGRPAVARGKVPSADPDPRLEEIYARNLATISAINRARGIRTLFVGQLMNASLLADEDSADGWIPFVKHKDLWPLVQRLNGIARAEAARLGDIYVDIPADRFTAADFLDHGHFSAGGAERFAELLAPAVRAGCGG